MPRARNCAGGFVGDGRVKLLFHSVGSGALEIASSACVGNRSASAVWWEVVRRRQGEMAGMRLRLRLGPGLRLEWTVWGAASA